jgi:hypothetical protein
MSKEKVTKEQAAYAEENARHNSIEWFQSIYDNVVDQCDANMPLVIDVFSCLTAKAFGERQSDDEKEKVIEDFKKRIEANTSEDYAAEHWIPDVFDHPWFS